MKRNDELLFEVAKFIVEKNYVSINLIQANFSLSFNQTISILDSLEDLGILGKSKEKHRIILVKNVENINSIITKKVI